MGIRYKSGYIQCKVGLNYSGCLLAVKYVLNNYNATNIQREITPKVKASLKHQQTAILLRVTGYIRKHKAFARVRNCNSQMTAEHHCQVQRLFQRHPASSCDISQPTTASTPINEITSSLSSNLTVARAAWQPFVGKECVTWFDVVQWPHGSWLETKHLIADNMRNYCNE